MKLTAFFLLFIVAAATAASFSFGRSASSGQGRPAIGAAVSNGFSLGLGIPQSGSDSTGAALGFAPYFSFLISGRRPETASTADAASADEDSTTEAASESSDDAAPSDSDQTDDTESPESSSDEPSSDSADNENSDSSAEPSSDTASDNSE